MSNLKYKASNITNYKAYRYGKKSDLHKVIREISEQSGVPIGDVGFIILTFLEHVADKTVENGVFLIQMFGSFQVVVDEYNCFGKGKRKVPVFRFKPCSALKNFTKENYKGGDVE